VRLRVTVIGYARSCSFVTACCILVGCPTGYDDLGDINIASISLNFQAVLLSVLYPQVHPSSYSKRSLSQASTTSTSSRTSQHSQKNRDKSSSLYSKTFPPKSPAPIDIPKSRSCQDSTVSQAQDIPRSDPTFHTSPITDITLPARQRCLPQFLHLGPKSVTLRPSKVQPQSAKTTAVIAGLSTTADGTQTIGFLVASVFVRLSARALRSFAAPTRTAE
jgi:hypothetical protein